MTPSTVWPADAVEKARIIEGYRTKLGSMDCRYFDFGEGTCPFGTSCFYRCDPQGSTVRWLALYSS